MNKQCMKKKKKVQDQNSKKIAQIFPQTCHAFCLRDFLLKMNDKNKKKYSVIIKAQTAIYQWECQSQCYESVNCISVKEFNQIKKTIICKLGLKKQPTFCDATSGFPLNDVWETNTEIPLMIMCYYPRLDIVLLIGWSKFPTNKKLYPDLASAYLWALFSQTSFFQKNTGGVTVNVCCFLKLVKWLFNTPCPCISCNL